MQSMHGHRGMCSHGSHLPEAGQTAQWKLTGGIAVPFGIMARGVTALDRSRRPTSITANELQKSAIEQDLRGGCPFSIEQYTQSQYFVTRTHSRA